MKIISVILVLVIILIIIAFINNKSKVTNEVNAIQSDIKENKGKADKENFDRLRSLAFSITSSQLGITPTSDKEVYGVIMDWEITDGIMTLVSFKTGDASIYLSNGSGFIGGGQHENVQQAAKEFVNKAQSFLLKAAAISVTPLPDKGCVRFYLLTDKGRYSAQIPIKSFDDNSSEWLPLFIEANKVITEYRKVTEASR